MIFKAKLQTPYLINNPELPVDMTLHFTKSQIIFPDTLTNGRFDNSNIKNHIHYKLIPHDNILPALRYEIEINNNETFRLVLDKKNERKLKWIHKLYPFQKEPIGTLGLIVAIISLLATTVLGVLKLIYR